MIRYTTPTITLKIPAVLPQEAKVIASIRQKQIQLDKEVIAITRGDKATTLVISLTQEESSRFCSRDPVLVQVNWITPGGMREATKVASVVAFDNLLDKVITYA